MKTKLLIHTDEVSKNRIDKMVDIGVDILGIHPVGGKFACENLERDLSIFASSQFRKLIDYAKNKGLEIQYEIHAAGFLLPRSLFDEHKEYFRTDKNGVRTSDFNFCVSQESALSRVTENAVKLSKSLYGSSSDYFFWLDDSADGGCYCDRCRNLSFSNQQLIVLNAVIKELRRNNPQAKLAYLAYYGTVQPPTVKPEQGIFLEYAPFTRDMKAPASSVSETDKQNISRLIDCFGAENSWVLEYWYDNSLFSDYTKPPVKFTADNETIKNDIAYYLDSGFKNVSSFACYLGQDYEQLFGAPDLSAFKKQL